MVERRRGRRHSARAGYNRLRAQAVGRRKRPHSLGLLRHDIRLRADGGAGCADGRHRAPYSQWTLAASHIARRRALDSRRAVQHAAVHPDALDTAAPYGRQAQPLVLRPRRSLAEPSADILAAHLGNPGDARPRGDRRTAAVAVGDARPSPSSATMARKDGASAGQRAFPGTGSAQPRSGICCTIAWAYSALSTS